LSLRTIEDGCAGLRIEPVKSWESKVGALVTLAVPIDSATLEAVFQSLPGATDIATDGVELPDVVLSTGALRTTSGSHL